MNISYLLIVFFNGSAMTIEMPDAHTCAEMQVYTVEQFKAAPPETKAAAKCFPKLGSVNKKS